MNEDLPKVPEEGTAQAMEPSKSDESVSTELNGMELRTSDSDESEEGSALLWMEELEYDSKHHLLKTLKNCELIFQHDEELEGLFGLNTFTDKTELRKDAPWERPEANPVKDTRDGLLWQPEFPEPEWRNSDYVELYAFMSRKYKFDNKTLIDQCVRMFATRNSFHPVREYLESLKWDGVKRIDSLFFDYFGIPEAEYYKTIMRKTLVAAVKRVFEPGCQFDAVLTMYGPQGCGKSMFWTNLAGRWFTDLLVNVGTKDALQSLEGVWVVELAELTALSDASIEKTKATITRKDDRYRKPYEMLVESHPRQCIFVATTNRPDFLKDSSGNRRFWIADVTPREVPLKSVWDDLAEEADMIWAEAKALYDEGTEALFLDPAMNAYAEKVQKSFMAYDPIRDAIEEYLARQITPDWWKKTPDEHRAWLKNSTNVGTVTRTQVCVKEIVREALGELVGATPSKSVLNEISTIVCSITYEDGTRWHKPEQQHQHRIPGYGKQRVFERY